MKLLQWLMSEDDLIPARARLPVALGLAICFAVGITMISVAIYVGNGAYRLDLSRPGFAREQAEVLSSASPNTTYDTTSPVTAQAITVFLRDFDTKKARLDKYGTFKDPALDDETLQITTH